MISDLEFRNKKTYIMMWKKEFDSINKIWLEAYNKAILKDKIDYDFIIFNEDFYINKIKCVNLNEPHSLSWLKPVPIISKLKTIKLMNEFRDYRYTLKEELIYSYNSVSNIIIHKTRWNKDDKYLIRLHANTSANLALTNSILRSYDLNYNYFL